MADDGEQEFANYLADLLSHHAAADIPVEQRGANINLARPAAPTVVSDLVSIIKQMAQEHFMPRGPGIGMRAPFPGEQPGPSDIATGLESATFPELGQQALAKGVGSIQKLITNYARQHPQQVRTLLASLGLLGGTAQTARSTGAGKVVPDSTTPEGYQAIEDDLQSKIDALDKKIEAAKKQAQKVTPVPIGRGRSRNATELDQAAFETLTKDDKTAKAILEQNLREMKEAEKPFLEKYPKFPDYMIGLGGALGTGMGYRAIEAARNAKKALGWFQKAGGPGMLVGLPEAALAFGVPEGEDIRGVGRARKAAEDETWGQLAKRAAIETAEAGGASGIGYKIGSLMLPSPVKGSSTANVLQQIAQGEQNADLRKVFAPRPQAPAALAPPVAAPPAAQRPVLYDKNGRPYHPGGGNPTAHGVPYRPPTAAVPAPAASAKTVPTETVIPSDFSNPSVRSILKQIGSKPGPEGGKVGGGPE